MDGEVAPSLEDIAWAAQSYHAGRPLEFVASVLGVKPKRAFGLIKQYRAEERMAKLVGEVPASAQRQEAEAMFARVTGARPIGNGEHHKRFDEEGAFDDRPQTVSQKAAMDEGARLDGRRKRLLRRRLASHWDMIWFLRGKGMRGRTIRGIYGADAIIWASGGGIDASI